MTGEHAMRVLVCTQGFPRHPDDHSAPFVLDHARALAASGMQVTVLCPSAPGLPARERFGDVEVVRFRYAPRRFETLAYTGAMHRSARGPKALLVPFLVIGFLVGAMRHARGQDVLHGHWWAPSGLVVVVAGRLAGVPSIVHVHGTDAAIARGPMRLLARWVLHHADGVLVASSALATWAQQVAGVDATVVPMPLSADRVPPPSAAPTDGPVLGIGRLVPEKGFDLLVRAAARSNLPLVLVGDGDERRHLEELAEELHADVTFVGFVPPSALAEWFARARLVAVPSRREGFGLVAAEALAAGRAVVASRVGGLPDVITDGVTGRLVPPDDVKALATALRETDPALGAAGPDAVGWLRPAPIAERTRAAYLAAASGVRPAAGPRLFRIGAGLFAVVAVAACVLSIRSQWHKARGLEISWSTGMFLGAVVAVAVANLVMAWAWGSLVRRLGGRLGWRAAMRVWWAGQLGRYLPTGLGSVPARVVLGARQGVPRRLLLATTAAEVGVVAAACGVLATLLLPVPALLLPIAALAAVIVLRVALRASLGRDVGWATAATYLGEQVLQVAIRAAGLWCLLHLVDPTTQPSPALVAGATGLAYSLGFVAVFAPGGLGVREATFVAVLGGTTGATAITAAAVLWRLLELAVELVTLAWSRTLDGTARLVPSSDGELADQLDEGPRLED
jgi:glycosyltransferase involved in cell wall biosynthesis/uncharacterized membrane protein YbhN (UPF0104 family)